MAALPHPQTATERVIALARSIDFYRHQHEGIVQGSHPALLPLFGRVEIVAMANSDAYVILNSSGGGAPDLREPRSMGATAAVFWGARLAAIAGTVGAFVAFAAGQGALVPFLVAFAVVMALVQLLPARQLVSAGRRLR